MTNDFLKKSTDRPARGEPFKWTKTADEILAKVKRFGQRTVQVHGGPR